MRWYVPLPAELHERPFTVAKALAAGVHERRLDAPDLCAPFHGVRAPAGSRRTAETYAPLLRPGDRYSHTTAAAVLGAPLPLRLAETVHVTAGPGLTRPRGQGVTGHRADGFGALTLFGLPISPPTRLFRELASVLDRDDLVAVGDWLTHLPRFPEAGRPWTTEDELAEALGVPMPHARAARAALRLIRPGVESRQETRLRLLLVAHGIPEPRCGYELHAGGRRIGWFDLAWPRHRVLGEYDGDQHRTSTEQYEKDIRRFDLAADAGWRVVRIRAHGLDSGRAETVDRFRRALGLDR